MRGPEKEGRMSGMKIRPAPREFQLKRARTRRGRVESKAVRRMAWTRVHQRAARRRGEPRRAKIGGRRDFVRVVVGSRVIFFGGGCAAESESKPEVVGVVLGTGAD